MAKRPTASGEKDDDRDPDPKRKRNVTNLIEAEEFFGQQYNTTAELPDPTNSLQAVATGVVEVIAGTRQVDQLARLLTDEVYQRLSVRAKLAREIRESKGIKARYQNFRIQRIAQESPRDGVIESVVLVNSAKRVRAVTIRLEGINHRWRATSVSVL
ncbi:MAG: Rv3235 family protein [Rhodoluna sp.]